MQEENLQGYVEKIGLLAEKYELPRMAGRILGWLLVCTPEHQSAEQMMDAIGASKGTISTMTRMLLKLNFIERVSLPGQRRDYFRIVRTAVWQELLGMSIVQMRQFRTLAEEGLFLLKEETPDNRRRLEEMHFTFTYFEEGLSNLLEQFKEKER